MYVSISRRPDPLSMNPDRKNDSTYPYKLNLLHEVKGKIFFMLYHDHKSMINTQRDCHSIIDFY